MVTYGPLADVLEFLGVGGVVLVLITLVIIAMWTLIFERVWYCLRIHPRQLARAEEEWEARRDRSSWYALQIRRFLISKLRLKLQRGLPIIKALILVCPLLGLLGTVLGMIDVFEVTALAGSGNVRAMASGVSKATITTMAGMVAALSGLLLSAELQRFVRNEGERIAERLHVAGG
jgi:biopolymer transport protein ExbB